jgi:hypothetical protein
MSDGIQRWSIGGCAPTTKPDDQGAYVTYSDHVEALRQAEIDAAKVWEQMSYDTGYAAGKRHMQQYLMGDDENSYAQGQRDALAGAVQRVDTHVPHDGYCNAPDEPCHCMVRRSAVIAAIKGSAE